MMEESLLDELNQTVDAMATEMVAANNVAAVAVIIAAAAMSLAAYLLLKN